MKTTTAVVCLKDKMVCGLADGTIQIWNSKKTVIEKTLTGHECGILHLDVVENDIVSMDEKYVAKTWDMKTGECKKTTTRFVSNGKILSGPEFAQGLFPSRYEKRTVSECAESGFDYEDKIVSGHLDTAIKIWDMKTGVCEKTLEGHDGEVGSVFVSDGKIVSGSWDHPIKIRDMQTGALENTEKSY